MHQKLSNDEIERSASVLAISPHRPPSWFRWPIPRSSLKFRHRLLETQNKSSTHRRFPPKQQQLLRSRHLSLIQLHPRSRVQPEFFSRRVVDTGFEED